MFDLIFSSCWGRFIRLKEMMSFAISDEFLGTFVPILVYWVYSGMYICLGSLDKYRLHSKIDEDEKNLVTKSAVVKGVLLQQTLQAIISVILFKVSVPLSISLPSLWQICEFIGFWLWIMPMLSSLCLLLIYCFG